MKNVWSSDTDSRVHYVPVDKTDAERKAENAAWFAALNKQPEAAGSIGYRPNRESDEQAAHPERYQNSLREASVEIEKLGPAFTRAANELQNIINKWPSDEPIEQLLDMLREEK